MKNHSCLVICFLLYIAITQACAANLTSLPLGPRAPQVVLWDADDSYPDKPLADARLDQPVQFWRAGLSMEEVFAEIQQQTGVTVRFWPPDDLNHRIRVNLYLNSKTPPKLRDLLAQLSWVIDCSFACTPEEPYTYYLLGTNEEQDIEAVLAADTKKNNEARQQQEDIFTNRLRERLAVYRTSLSLSSRELITRYQGVDDRLLFDLLQPARKAAVQFVFTLPPEMFEQFFKVNLSQAWTNLSPEQQTLIRILATEGEATPQTTITLNGKSYGDRGFYLFINDVGDEANGTYRPLGRVSSVACAPTLPMSVTERLSLRRLLGETVSLEEQTRLLEEEQAQSRSAIGRMGREEALVQSLRPPALSPSTEIALLSARLLFESEGHTWFRLWQLQEAAARLTGRHVVSDCYYQPTQGLFNLHLIDPEYRQEVLRREQRIAEIRKQYHMKDDVMVDYSLPKEIRHELNSLQHLPSRTSPLLYWLCIACQPSARRLSLQQALYNPMGMEWGDAGSFLHFRSTYRELMRGAMLPEESLQLLEEMESPPVKQLDLSASDIQAGYDADLPRMIRLIAPLNDAQLALGFSLFYEDPSTPSGDVHATIRLNLSEYLLGHSRIIKFLATLTPQQWKQLYESGLNLQRHLTPDQKRMPFIQEASQQWSESRTQSPGLAEITLRVISPQTPQDSDAPPPVCLAFFCDGKQGEAGWLFARMRNSIPLHHYQLRSE